MKIAVNTRFLLDGKLEGIGWFTYETLKRIVDKYPEHQFYFLFDRPYSSKFVFSKNVTPIVVFPPARHPFLWYIWFEWSVPWVLKKIKPDILVSTDGYIPLNISTPTLNVIHDLNFEHNPDYLRGLIKKYYLHYFPKFARKSTRLVTVSNFSKSDLISIYGISPEKIDVAYNGAGTSYHPIDDKQKQAVKDEYFQGKDYFIYIGALLPRKNVTRLLLAYDLFREQSKSEVKLVLVGAKMFGNQQMEETYQKMKHKQDVHFMGHISTGSIEKILGASMALTYISIFEGFGIPIVEAMYAEIPVITSNQTALPEVAGDAALIVDPYNVNDIADAMNQIHQNPELSKELVAKGKKRREAFNWDFTAQKLWESIIKCIETKN